MISANVGVPLCHNRHFEYPRPLLALGMCLTLIDRAILSWIHEFSSIGLLSAESDGTFPALKNPTSDSDHRCPFFDGWHKIAAHAH